MFLVIATLFAGLFVWASQAEVDQVIRAEAKVVPINDVVRVQNRFAGTLTSVEFELGDRVSKGQVLFLIDPEDSAIDLDQNEQALKVVRAQHARLAAQLNNAEPEYSNDIPVAIQNSQTALLVAKRSELKARDQLLESQATTLRIAIKEAVAGANAAQEQARLVRAEIELVKPLVTAKAEPEVRLIRLNRELSELGERTKLSELSANRLEAEIDAIQNQRAQLKDAFVLENQELLAETLVEIGRLEKDVERAAKRASLNQVLSPIDGIITALPFAVVGQIADAGTVLAEVVPTKTEYRAEARLRPMDVGNVTPGQPARLSLAAYDFADYGHIDAKLIEVAQNITEEPQTEPYHKAIFSIEATKFSKSGEHVELMPGLLGHVDVLGEPVTVLSYVTKPVTKLGSRALTEQ